jgi:Uma2 family endonuclease
MRSMASAARKLATYDDVLRAPEHVVAEVIDGDLHLQPRPARRHARAFSRLGARLGRRFDEGDDGPGGWVLLNEPELHLGAQPHILVPDIAGWRRERMPVIEDGPYFDLAPDWVCEVLSPSTAAFDRGRKADVYLEVGVKHLWLVDADTPQIEAFEAVEGRWLRLGAYREADARIVPFDAVPLDVPSLIEGVAPKR